MGIWEVLLIIFLLLSAFFSASETALTSLSPTILQHLIEKKSKSLLLWMENHAKVLITILIGNNLVNIFSASIATILAKKYFENIGIAFVAGIMTFIIITFGEIFPKSIARRYNEKISVVVMPLIEVFYFLFYPFTLVFYSITKIISKKGHISFDERDLFYAIYISSQRGYLKNKADKIILSVLNLKDLTISDIMIPRTSVCYASSDTKKEDLMKIFINSGYSRIPIYEGSEDNIIGILHLKELLKEYKDLKEILKPPFFVYENLKAILVLEEMKKKKMHMACVVDEYGSFSGIVTMEDIIEEIVGEIEDEYDKKEEEIVKLSNDEYLFKADISINSIKNLLPIDFPKKKEYKTLGGFVFYNLNRMAKKGDRLEFDGFEFEVMETSGRKPLKIKVKKISKI